MMAKDVRERMEEVGMMCTLDMANVVEGRSRNRVTPIATAPPLKIVEQSKRVNRAELVSTDIVTGLSIFSAGRNCNRTVKTINT